MTEPHTCPRCGEYVTSVTNEPSDDFLDRAYAPDSCPVSWCDRGIREHERIHQGVIWQAVSMPPAWRGQSIMTAQAVLAGHDEETFEVGLTIISNKLAQMSIVPDWDSIERLRDALTKALALRAARKVTE